MFGITKQKETELHASTDTMMEWMFQHGNPIISNINGAWWCYFKYKKGPIELQIDSNGRKPGMPLRDQVESCYLNVRKAMEALAQK